MAPNLSHWEPRQQNWKIKLCQHSLWMCLFLMSPLAFLQMFCIMSCVFSCFYPFFDQFVFFHVFLLLLSFCVNLFLILSIFFILKLLFTTLRYSAYTNLLRNGQRIIMLNLSYWLSLCETVLYLLYRHNFITLGWFTCLSGII